jgi:hypothetical protein
MDHVASLGAARGPDEMGSDDDAEAVSDGAGSAEPKVRLLE